MQVVPTFVEESVERSAPPPRLQFHPDGFRSIPYVRAVAISKAVEMDCRLLVMDEECLNPCIIKRSFLTDHIILMDSYKTRSAEATRRESHRTYIMPGTRYPCPRTSSMRRAARRSA